MRTVFLRSVHPLACSLPIQSPPVTTRLIRLSSLPRRPCLLSGNHYLGHLSTFNWGLYVQLCFRLFMSHWDFPNSWTSLFYHTENNTRFTSIRGPVICQGCPGSSLVKQETQETWVWSWVGKIFWGRKWPPTPVFLPAKFHGQRRLVGYSP